MMNIEFDTLYSDIQENEFYFMKIKNGKMESWQLELIKKMNRFCIPYMWNMIIVPAAWPKEQAIKFRDIWQKAIDKNYEKQLRI